MSSFSISVEPELFTAQSVVAPFVTPALPKGGINSHSDVDVKSISRLVAHTQRLKADAGVALGATGEFHQMHEDRIVVVAQGFIDSAREFNLPLIVNVTGLFPPDTIDRFDAIKGMSPGGIMLAPMMGNEFQRDAIDHILRVGIDCPVYLYDNPALTKLGPIPDELIEQFSQSKRLRFVGIKDSSKDLGRKYDLMVMGANRDFIFMDGNEVREPLHMDHPQFRGIVASGAQLSDIYVRLMRDPHDPAIRQAAIALTDSYTQQGVAAPAGAKYLLYTNGVISSDAVFGLSNTISADTKDVLDDYAKVLRGENLGLRGTVEGRRIPDARSLLRDQEILRG